jgi:phage repressor protein C with HTH and peptisase S24 domain
LEAGRNLIKGRKIRSAEEDWRGLTGDELRERGFITVPFSDNMKLSAGSGGTIVDVTDDADASTVIVHGPSLRRTSSRNLQAFRVGGDSMEPIIAQNGIIIADLSENDPGRLKEGKIYVLCYDLLDGECSVKYLHWAERNRLLAISSPDESRHRPVYKRLDEVVLIGRAIWAWREL